MSGEGEKNILEQMKQKLVLWKTTKRGRPGRQHCEKQMLK